MRSRGQRQAAARQPYQTGPGGAHHLAAKSDEPTWDTSISRCPLCASDLARALQVTNLLSLKEAGAPLTKYNPDECQWCGGFFTGLRLMLSPARAPAEMARATLRLALAKVGEEGIRRDA